jgi:hypothetical protein
LSLFLLRRRTTAALPFHIVAERRFASQSVGLVGLPHRELDACMQPGPCLVAWWRAPLTDVAGHVPTRSKPPLPRSLGGAGLNLAEPSIPGPISFFYFPLLNLPVNPCLAFKSP